MMPQHLFEELQTTAALYALGALPSHDVPAFADLASGAGRTLAREIASFDAVLVELALGTAEHAPPATTRQKLQARIAIEAEAQAQRVPYNSAQFLNLGAAEGHWQDFSAGVQAKHLFQDQAQGTVTYLLKLAPGAELPLHHHRGAEQCYILEGDFRANELHLGPGDFHVALPGSTHETISSETGALVLIVAPDHASRVS